MKNFKIDTKDYDDLIVMILESTMAMRAITMKGSKSDKRIKKIDARVEKIEEKYNY